MAHRGTVIFVGSLPLDIREREIEDLFYKYGRIRNIDLKTPLRPPAYAFVEFSDPRDAQDAVRGRDGYDFAGNRLRVEISRGSQDSFGGSGGGGGGGGGHGGGGYGGFNRGRREVPPPAPASFHGRGTGFRALVKGLPQSASWQDLKDHFRKVVKPSYTNVFRDRGGLIGVVEFENQEDLDLAIRKLDDTEFKNPFERCYVRVIDDSDYKKDRARSRSRSRARSYSSSASRSRSRSRSRSASRSKSPGDDREKKRESRSPVDDRSASRSKSPDKVPNGTRDSPMEDGTPPKMDRSPGRHSPEDDRDDGDAPAEDDREDREEDAENQED